MTLEYGAKCPAFEYHDNVGLDCCRGCRGCRGMYANGVDCGFSKIPTTEPKFNVGDTVYYVVWPNLPFVIRKREWDGRFSWVYYFTRERTPRDESSIFRTPKEAEAEEIRRKFAGVKSMIASYMGRYGGSLEDVTRELLPEDFTRLLPNKE